MNVNMTTYFTIIRRIYPFVFLKTLCDPFAIHECKAHNFMMKYGWYYLLDTLFNQTFFLDKIYTSYVISSLVMIVISPLIEEFQINWELGTTIPPFFSIF